MARERAASGIRCTPSRTRNSADCNRSRTARSAGEARQSGTGTESKVTAWTRLPSTASIGGGRIGRSSAGAISSRPSKTYDCPPYVSADGCGSGGASLRMPMRMAQSSEMPPTRSRRLNGGSGSGGSPDAARSSSSTSSASYASKLEKPCSGGWRGAVWPAVPAASSIGFSSDGLRRPMLRVISGRYPVS
eukprot:scaffold7135_cov96-Isochrysis_galbana.AAC.2